MYDENIHCAGHRFQGQTVAQPNKIVGDLRSVFQAAQAYVMLSRVQSIQQLLIVGELPAKKLYADQKALNEVKRLEAVSLNNNPTVWNQKSEVSAVKICFLNCQSLKLKFSSLQSDGSLQMATVIMLSETWLDDTDTNISLPGYNVSLNNVGRGGGTATFYRGNFTLECEIQAERMNISKVASNSLDVIGVYRSNSGNLEDLIDILQSLINLQRPTVIGGDFNLDLHKDKDNIMTQYLITVGFKQVVTKGTHIQGGLLDHCYIRLVGEHVVELVPKFYSDHESVCVTCQV